MVAVIHVIMFNVDNCMTWIFYVKTHFIKYNLIISCNQSQIIGGMPYVFQKMLIFIEKYDTKGVIL